MSTQGLRKCCHCGVWFKPGRNAWHQHFCLKTECRAASKLTSQQAWCRKSPGYFHGEVHVKKTQVWRRKHPGYWKKKTAGQQTGPPDALQDLLLGQGFDNEGVKSFRICLEQEISRPLQDVIVAQRHAIVGLTAMITGDELQEDIASVLTACYQRGQRIGGIMPWMKPQEVNHERARSDSDAETATHSGTVQLGGSQAGS